MKARYRLTPKADQDLAPHKRELGEIPSKQIPATP